MMLRFLSRFFLVWGFLSLIAGPLYGQDPAKNAIQLSWDFDNGSLGGWSMDERGEVILNHAEGSGELWYYFRVDGVEGKRLTFVFENARNDFYGGDSLPSISYDQNHWSFIKERIVQPLTRDANRVRYSFTHTFAANRAWLAFAPPYPNKRLNDLLSEIPQHPHGGVEPLCQTPIRKLPLSLITITDPETPNQDKRCTLFLVREEAMESASSWICEGLIRFLLSDDPVASALKRRCIFLIIPMLDRDGVALGSAVHPITEGGPSVFWTEAWPESSYSFYEQRQIKRFLQGWKDTGKTIHYSFRLHSSAWNQDYFRREHCAEGLLSEQEAFFEETLGGKYLPWYHNLARVLQDTRFSKFVADLFPEAITGLFQCEHRYDGAFGLPFTLYKSPDDLRTEGVLMAFALAETMGVPASDPPPFLHAAELYETSGRSDQIFHVRCIYRDILNRPPQFVRVVMGEQEIELTPMRNGTGELNYQTGVLYTGMVTSTETIGSHYFVTSNGTRNYRIPQEGSHPGPLLHTVIKKK